MQPSSRERPVRVDQRTTLQAGQHLDGPDDRATSLVITQVTPAQVTLEANGNRYTLAYPDQLTAAAGPRSTAGAGPRSTAGAAQRGGRPGPSGRSALPRR